MLKFLGSAEQFSVFEYTLRTIAVGVEIYFLGRYLPRRSGGPFAGYDFAFFWMMGGLAASPLFEAKISFGPTIISAITIYLIHYGISTLATKNRTFAKLLMGEPTVLIDKGQVSRKNMLKSLMPVEMLVSELRGVNVFNFSDVEYAILETSGHVSVIKKLQNTPVAAQDLHISVQNTSSPLLVINDGQIVEGNIKQLGHTMQEFLELLASLCTLEYKQIYVATLDMQGNFYYSPMEYDK